MLSNIAAGSVAQLDSVFQHRELLERVIEIARTDRWEVRKEALWVVSNMFTTGGDNQVRTLVQQDGFAALVDALENVQDSKILLVALEAIEVVLKLGNGLGLNYANMFDELNGIDKLEELQEHPSEDVYQKAVDIMEQYFGVEDEEDENIAPAHEDGMFSFGMNPPAKQLFPEASEGDKFTAVLGQSNYDLSMQH